MGSDWDWLHDWIVGGVSDRRLGEDFDKGVKSCQVDVPASMISMEALSPVCV